MVFKASILLLYVFTFGGGFVRAASLESELTEAVQKRDWPGVVLLLKPFQGQSFDHDVILTKAFVSLERRPDALALASKLYMSRKDEKSRALLDLAGTLFFNQETSNFYYEAVRLMSISKFLEAKERLDLALAKEPGHVLVLTRLIQIELVLGLKVQAADHLKIAQIDAPFSTELKLFGAKLALEGGEEEQEWYQDFLPLKSALLENEVTATFWFEALRRTKKNSELSLLSNKFLKEHPSWTYALVWFTKNGSLNPKQIATFNSRIGKNLKDKNQFNALLETEMKQAQYYWVGYVIYDDLLKYLK